MSDSSRYATIRDILVRLAESHDPLFLFPTVVPEAQTLSLSDPYVFCIACCLDRGKKSEVIWTIPWDIKQELGHLNPMRIHRMSLKDLHRMFQRLPRKPRYINDAPETLKGLTAIVVERYQGDASLIWKGQLPFRVKDTFESIYGVGPALSNMALLLIDRAFPGEMSDYGRSRMDIKPDVHTKRVLHRLGVAATEEEGAVIRAARILSPEFPGAIDPGLWYVGREWCHASAPRCDNCELREYCDFAAQPS